MILYICQFQKETENGIETFRIVRDDCPGANDAMFRKLVEWANDPDLAFDADDAYAIAHAAAKFDKQFNLFGRI